MKKRIITLALSAVFVLAAFSGCATTRRETHLRGTEGLERSSNSLRNFFARNTTNPSGTREGRRLDGLNAYNVPISDDNDFAAYRRPITVDHLTSLVGMNEADIDTAFGRSYRANNVGTMSGRTYNHMMYGNAADIDVTFDNGKQIDRIVVTASRNEAERWQRELDARYGTQNMAGISTNEWTANGTRIVMQPMGDNVRIVFSNTL